jgi:hypothetical protein
MVVTHGRWGVPRPADGTRPMAPVEPTASPGDNATFGSRWHDILSQCFLSAPAHGSPTGPGHWHPVPGNKLSGFIVYYAKNRRTLHLFFGKLRGH